MQCSKQQSENFISNLCSLLQHKITVAIRANITEILTALYGTKIRSMETTKPAKLAKIDFSLYFKEFKNYFNICYCRTLPDFSRIIFKWMHHSLLYHSQRITSDMTCSHPNTFFPCSNKSFSSNGYVQHCSPCTHSHRVHYETVHNLHLLQKYQLAFVQATLASSLVGLSMQTLRVCTLRLHNQVKQA